LTFFILNLVSRYSASAAAISANALIDTGAILALLDRSDRWHDGCVDAFRQLRLPLLTSEAVLTSLDFSGYFLALEKRPPRCVPRLFLDTLASAP
jgi:predicted nucleic acid-binding protein